MRGCVVAVTAVVVMVTLTGCGRDSARRQAVADYVDAVNRVETQLRKPLIELQHTNARFSTKTPAKTHARAVHARQTIAQLQHVLQGLKPPSQAARLHARLLALVSAELSLAREVERLSLFLPGIQRALAPLPATQRKLNAALRASKRRSSQVRALETYGHSLEQPIFDLIALDPPPLSAPVRDGQLHTLEQVRTLALALADALRRHANAKLPALQRQFLAAAQSDQTLAAQQARIAAVVAYNKRVRHLSDLAQRVQHERDRLDKKLP